MIKDNLLITCHLRRFLLTLHSKNRKTNIPISRRINMQALNTSPLLFPLHQRRDTYQSGNLINLSFCHTRYNIITALTQYRREAFFHGYENFFCHRLYVANFETMALFTFNIPLPLLLSFYVAILMIAKNKKLCTILFIPTMICRSCQI